MRLSPRSLSIFAPGLAPGAALVMALVLLAIPRPALAGGPASAISVQLPSLNASGMNLQYERFALPDAWSLAAGLGLRSTAGGDYDSMSMSAGAEIRYWFTGRAFRSSLRHAMVGPFAAARFDMGRTTTSMDERTIGTMLTLTETLSLGYRFAMWQRVELTPSLGLALRTDIDRHGSLPTATRGTPTLGLTLGWMY